MDCENGKGETGFRLAHLVRTPYNAPANRKREMTMISTVLALSIHIPWPIYPLVVVAVLLALANTPAFKGMLRIGVMQTGQKEKDS